MRRVILMLAVVSAAIAGPGSGVSSAQTDVLPGLGTPRGKNGFVVYTQDRRYDSECGCSIGRAANGIFVFDPKTGKKKRIVASSSAGSPHFSRDGSRIVYADTVGLDWELFSIKPGGAGRRQLTHTRDQETRPQILVGGRIAYRARTRRGIVLRTMRIDGSRVHTVGKERDIEIGAASPDGRKIVYEKCSDRKTCDLFIHDVRKDTTRRLTRWGGRDSDPSFSPDGERIIYMSNRPDPDDKGDSDPQVWVMRSDGSRPHREARPIGDAALANPQFAPDGRHFLVEFLSFYDYGQGDIGSLVIDRLGDGDPRFIEAEGILYDADWQAR